jgi:hypothetical protein
MTMTDDATDKFAGETDTEIRMLGRYIVAVESGILRVKEDAIWGRSLKYAVRFIRFHLGEERLLPAASLS